MKSVGLYRGKPARGAVFEEGDEQVNGDGSRDLSVDGFGGSGVRSFEAQVLIDHLRTVRSASDCDRAERGAGRTG